MAVLVLFTAIGVAADECASVIARPPYGAPRSVAVSGNTAYLGSGAALLILDISTPENPVEIARLSLPDQLMGVVVSNGHAYIAAADAGVRIVDVSDPGSPFEVAHYQPPGWSDDLSIAGDLIFLAGGAAGLGIIDVSDPNLPVELSFFDTDGDAYDVEVAGALAFVSDWQEGLRIIDVSDPASPVEVSFFDTPGKTDGLALADGFAYVADGADGLVVVDVSDPQHPVARGVLPTSSHASNATWLGNGMLALAASPAVLVDVSDPDAPVAVAELSFWAYDLAVAGELVLGASNGLQLASISDPSAPEDLAVYTTAINGYSIAAVGDLAVVGVQGLGLRTYDIADSSSPAELGFLEIGGVHIYGVTLRGTNAYLAELSTGVHVIDVASPAEPVEIGLMPSLFPVATAVELDYAYVVSPVASLRMFDIRDLTRPQSLTTAPVLGWDIDVVGDYAYVAAADSGIRVLTISEVPPSLIEVAALDTPGTAYGVRVVDGLAYVADYSSLRVIDVSDPWAPVEVGSCDQVWGRRLAVLGDYVYITGENIGAVLVVDVSDPTAPFRVAWSYETGLSSRDVVLVGNSIIAADNQAGITVHWSCAMVFSDGFEAGDANAWSDSAP